MFTGHPRLPIHHLDVYLALDAAKTHPITETATRLIETDDIDAFAVSLGLLDALLLTALCPGVVNRTEQVKSRFI